MTLLITIFAAVAVTVKWYNRKNDDMRLGSLALMYWGASLMWLVDAIAEYIELEAEFFNPEAADMLNDSFLGLTVVALGLVIWVVRLLIADPKGVVKKAFARKTDAVDAETAE